MTELVLGRDEVKLELSEFQKVPKIEVKRETGVHCFRQKKDTFVVFFRCPTNKLGRDSVGSLPNTEPVIFNQQLSNWTHLYG